MDTKVKICCIADIEEAYIAIKHGAKAIGLVGNMPSGPGVISDEQIAKIAKEVPAEIWTFLLTSETKVSEIIAHHQRTQTNTIQIVDKISEGTYAQLRAALPGVRLVQVIHVLDENSVLEAVEISKEVDIILLDSGNPNLKVKELGGTGKIHNWDLSQKIVEAVNVPVFLAGGIKESNVQDAFNQVDPFGLDLCSSVRSAGKLDEEKLKRFFAKVNETE